MANGRRIDFEVGFNVNVETLKKASQEIHSIQSLVADDLIQGGDTRAITEIEDGLKKAKDAAKQLGDAFDSSFNKDLGVMNIAKFQQQLHLPFLNLILLDENAVLPGILCINHILVKRNLLVEDLPLPFYQLNLLLIFHIYILYCYFLIEFLYLFLMMFRDILGIR